MAVYPEVIDALTEIREAILNDVAEDIAVVGEPTEWHENLVIAWNKLAAVFMSAEQITEADIEGKFE